MVVLLLGIDHRLAEFRISRRLRFCRHWSPPGLSSFDETLHVTVASDVWRVAGQAGRMMGALRIRDPKVNLVLDGDGVYMRIED